MGFFSSSAPVDPDERLRTSLETLLAKAESLDSSLAPEPAKIGYINGAFLGPKVKSVRAALDGTTAVIESIAKDTEGKLTAEQVTTIHDFLQKDLLSLMENILHRCSVVHKERFAQLGVSHWTELGLTWFVESFGSFIDTFEAAIPNEELLAKAKPLDERILTACQTALKTHNGGKETS